MVHPLTANLTPTAEKLSTRTIQLLYLVELDRVESNRFLLTALELEGPCTHLADSIDDVFLCSSPLSSLLVEVLLSIDVNHTREKVANQQSANERVCSTIARGNTEIPTRGSAIQDDYTAVASLILYFLGFFYGDQLILDN